MHRLFGDELPDRTLALADRTVVERGVGLVALREHERDHSVGNLLAKQARQPIAGRTGRRLAVPRAVDEIAQLRARAAAGRSAAGVSVRRMRSRHRARNAALRFELNVEQVCGSEPVLRHEPVADDARPRADLVAAVSELREHLAVHDARSWPSRDVRSRGREFAGTPPGSASRSNLVTRRPTTAADGHRIRRVPESIRRPSSRYVPACRRPRSSGRARRGR